MLQMAIANARQQKKQVVARAVVRPNVDNNVEALTTPKLCVCVTPMVVLPNVVINVPTFVLLRILLLDTVNG
jgi:hypothetical protein